MQLKRVQKKMKTVKFVITREDVYKRIFTTSAYTARAREAMGIPAAVAERMLITADDKEAVDPLIDNGMNAVLADIVRYHPGSSMEFTQDEYGGYYMFHMKAAESYPTGNEEMLTQSIGSYVANRTLQNWYADIKPDEAAMTVAKMQNDATTIHLLLTRREKPKNIFQDI